MDRQLERLFKENFPIIRAKCARMLGEGEEGADVAQETFVRLCETGAVHLAPEARLGWIYATSTRLAIDLLRRRRLGVELRPADPDAHANEAASGGSPADEVLAARQALLAVAAAAPRDELQVAILCRIDQLTQPEAARVCDVSERTVRRLLERFDRRLAELEGSSS